MTSSREHFAGLCELLESAGIAYTVNQRLVRGLDYYNRTVFEWVTSSLGSQGTVLCRWALRRSGRATWRSAQRRPWALPWVWNDLFC